MARWRQKYILIATQACRLFIRISNKASHDGYLRWVVIITNDDKVDTYYRSWLESVIFVHLYSSEMRWARGPIFLSAQWPRHFMKLILPLAIIIFVFKSWYLRPWDEIFAVGMTRSWGAQTSINAEHQLSPANIKLILRRGSSWCGPPPVYRPAWDAVSCDYDSSLWRNLTLIIWCHFYLIGKLKLSTRGIHAINIDELLGTPRSPLDFTEIAALDSTRQ